MALRQAFNGLRAAIAPRLTSDVYRGVCSTSIAFQAQEAPAPAPAAKAGWGQTRIHDILLEKGDSQGRWLWCSRDDFVIDAVKKMTKGNVGSLLVFDPSKLNIGSQDDLKHASSEAVAGLVTERDYLTKVVVLGKSSARIHVAEIMTPEAQLKTVGPNDTVLEVMSLMMQHNFRHVPVVDHGNYLGMVSIRDVVNTMVQEHREEVERLHEYISGGY